MKKQEKREWVRLEAADKEAALSAARRRGTIQAGHDPADILVLTLALAQAWFTAARGPDLTDPDTARPPQRLAQHRAALVDAVSRLSVPPKDPAGEEATQAWPGDTARHSPSGRAAARPALPGGKPRTSIRWRQPWHGFA
ncbi:hypothetical protein [Streptomyces fodineus]|uniref:hypothetical protein n=1 Tax=Streptomyces fodineus TaxID=1904616 RepID=UPI00131EBDA3|nr:hypothetical protein [Streptomyces fodineus]